MKYKFLVGSVLLGLVFGLSSAFAADVTSIASTGVIIHGAPLASPQQLQLQLQSQELDLEQQLLDVKRKLFQLQQEKATQDLNRTTEATQAKNEVFKWVDAKGGKVPDKAIVAAYYKDQPVYICHADYLEGIHPGQVVKDGCLISYGPKSFVQDKYQVLTGTGKTLWKSADTLTRYLTPAVYYSSYDVNRDSVAGIYPIKGGFETSRTLYICRVMYGDGIHVGKLVENNCNIGVDNVELRLPTYEVLFSYIQ